MPLRMGWELCSPIVWTAKWLPGVITTVRGSQSYDITLEDGRITRHHVDHIRECSDSTSAEPTDIWLPDSIESPDPPTSTTPERMTPDNVTVRRSNRVRVAPDWFDPSSYYGWGSVVYVTLNY